MAEQRAIVWRTDVSPNRLGRLLAGDTLSGAGATFVVGNNQGAEMVKCQPVYVSGPGHISLARADMLVTARVVGLVASDTIANGDPGNVQVVGELVATTGQWDAVTGQTGGLTPAANYYLSNTDSGMLTTTPPSSGVNIQVGTANDTTKMVIDLKPLIKLRA